jgi:uncharacterized Zn-finger protein
MEPVKMKIDDCNILFLKTNSKILLVFSDQKASCQKRQLNLHVSIVLKYSPILEACVSISSSYKRSDKGYICSYCAKSFAAKGPYKEHLRIHTGEKPYSCPECTKTFTTANQMKIHFRGHSGEKTLWLSAVW